jgi:quinol monooxygenase YgiN
MNGPIAIVATITTQTEHAEAVELALRKAVLQVREEAGCEHYVLHRDLADANRFVMIERWRDGAALAAHAQAPAFLALAKALDGIATLQISKLSALV